MNLVDLNGICGWCIRFDQRCMDICRGKNQQHTHFSLIYVTKVRRLPEYMWIRINSKKKKRNTEWLAMWNHTFLFYEFHHVYCTYVNCNSVTSRELMVWYSRRSEQKKQQKPNDWDFNIQFRMWLFWISIIQHLKWHSLTNSLEKKHEWHIFTWYACCNHTFFYGIIRARIRVNIWNQFLLFQWIRMALTSLISISNPFCWNFG